MYKKYCESCHDPFRTNNSKTKICSEWDCIRLALIKTQPDLVFKHKSLEELAFANGIEVVKTRDGAKLVPLNLPEHIHQRWQEDQAKIVQRAIRQRRYVNTVDGDYTTVEDWAWNRAAKATMRRITSKYPSKRMAMLAEKGNGRVYAIVDGHLIERVNYNI